MATDHRTFIVGSALARAALGAALCAELLSGCLASPRGGDQLAHADDPLVVEGVVERADQPVVVEAFDHAQRRWTTIATVEPDELVRTVSPLGVGYRFRAEVALPESAGYFVPGSTPSSLRAQVRARQGVHSLASFDADGERCLRALADSQAASLRGDASALVNAGLTRCAARGSPSVEVSVPHCGAEGESCCARFGGSDDELCRADLTCERSSSQQRCTRPAYSVPWLHDHAEDLAIPEDAHLREAWLELDDTSVGTPSRVALVSKREPAASVTLEHAHQGLLRLRFDVPFVRPGTNRFRVVALVESSAGVVQRSTPWQSVDYTFDARLGHVGEGRFALPTQHFPMRMRDCRGPCIDRDGDGLSDLWENVALEQLRPRLLLDADDRVFETGDPVRLLSSIVPLQRNGREYVLFAHVVTFARDFGPPGLRRLLAHGHAGDTEAFGMAFAVRPDGELQWAASVAKGHACLTCKKPGWHWEAQEFDTDGVPLLTVEEDKHGLWQRRSACQQESIIDCEADKVLRPVAVNAGDAHVGGAAALVDVFDDIDPKGPYAALAGAFPGEAMWSGARARVPGRFCGGQQKGCTKLKSAKLPGDVLASVIERLRVGTW